MAATNTTFELNRITNNAVSANFYIGLSTTTPTSAGGNVTEPPIGTNGYARLEILPSEMTTSVGGVSSLNAEQTFAQSTGDWLAAAPITHILVFDAPTGGNLRSFEAIAGTTQGVVAGTTFRIPVSGITYTSIN